MSIQDDGVYLIDGTRTAIGAYGGSSAHTRPTTWRQRSFAVAAAPSGGGSEPDEVVLGCANRAGEDNRNVARMAARCRTGSVGAGHHPQPPLRLRVDAVIYAAAKIRSGLSELILAGGVEA